MENFEIEVVEVKANPERQLSSDWKIQQIQNLQAIYGIELNRWIMYPNGAPWYIKAYWKIEDFVGDVWYKYIRKPTENSDYEND